MSGVRRTQRVLGAPITRGGFPHSEIRGSKLVRSSPRLIAAYHVLHRLSAPRHPPNALKALDRSHAQCPLPHCASAMGTPFGIPTAHAMEAQDIVQKDQCHVWTR